MTVQSIYELGGNREDYAVLFLTLDDAIEDAKTVLVARDRVNGWVPLNAEFVDDNPIPDIADLAATGIVFSDSAREALDHLFKPHGEFLPLQIGRTNHYLFHPLTRLDVLDREDSEIISRDADGRVLSVDTFMFVPEHLSTCNVFALEEGDEYSIFISEHVVDVIQSSGIAGFSCRLVFEYDLETGLRRGHYRWGLTASIIYG